MKKLFETSYIYAILIFIGFYNYHSFYNQFDISIASYLSIGELLLSFLPLSTFLLGLLGFLFIYFIGAIVNTAFIKEKHEKKEHEEDSYNAFSLFIFTLGFKSIKQRIKDKKLKSFSSILWLIFDSFLVLLGTLFFIFFIWYIFHYFKKVFGGETLIPSNYASLLLFGIMWFGLFADLVNRNSEITKDLVYPMWFLMMVFYFLGIIKVKNHEFADAILKGDYKVQFEIEYQNQTISTSNDLIYIGKTEKYIFLREKQTGLNVVYSTDQIGKMEFLNMDNQKEKTGVKVDSTNVDN